jgi:hypothetical protein
MSTFAHGQAARGHRYGIGDWVSLAQGFGYAQRTGAVYEVVAHLPSDRGHLQYRIRAATEAFERVAAENQLALQPTPATASAPAPGKDSARARLAPIRRGGRR